MKKTYKSLILRFWVGAIVMFSYVISLWFIGEYVPDLSPCIKSSTTQISFSIRYYAHVSFLITTHALKGKKDFTEYVAKTLNRGSYSWSLGLRIFYLSFPLVLWIYGPIPMFVCCCLTSFTLYFLDTTTQITRDLHTKSFNKRETEDMEAP
ncbi:hypothetical protein PHAVU_002G325600 [Phaseolus vulgaris]|uniref:Uncharacterized protein n=1 Tax=Phaseolus vulgaris TaxID=3885 RepID=V7CQT1_PHAVU|nr:hypothetical protein PHAVU_002G325600g [Phaseolus vulgaris]ESW32474.1 hypothetical protein PHAVU_002G325600g [Phaseolus vulgaris]